MYKLCTAYCAICDVPQRIPRPHINYTSPRRGFMPRRLLRKGGQCVCVVGDGTVAVPQILRIAQHKNRRTSLAPLLGELSALAD